MSRSFLEVDDLGPGALAALLERAIAWKADPSEVPPVLEGKGAAALFEKPSARTRISIEMAVAGNLALREPRQRSRALKLTKGIREYRNDYVANIVRFRSRAAFIEAVETEGKLVILDIRRDFSEFHAAERKLASSRERSAESKSRHAIELGVAGLVAIAAFMLLFGLYLARSIARPVREVAEGASRLAGGELSLRLEQGGPGEVGELTSGFNHSGAVPPLGRVRRTSFATNS